MTTVTVCDANVSNAGKVILRRLHTQLPALPQGCCMNGTVKEWAAKAEADFLTATREATATESPNFDAVVFTPKLAQGWRRPTHVRTILPVVVL